MRTPGSNAIEHGNPGLRLAAVDVRSRDVAAASHHPRKDGGEVGRRTHGSGNQQWNILDDLRIYTAAKFGVLKIER